MTPTPEQILAARLASLIAQVWEMHRIHPEVPLLPVFAEHERMMAEMRERQEVA